MLASENCHVDIVRLLVDKGASVDLQNEVRCRPPRTSHFSARVFISNVDSDPSRRPAGWLQ